MPRGIPKNKARPRDLMVVGKRNNIDRERDGWFVINEYSKGKNVHEITQMLNERNDKYSLSERRVREDIREMLIEWKRDRLSSIDAYIAKELLKIEHLEEVAWANLEASKTFHPQEYASLIKLGYTREDIDQMYEGKEIAGNPAFLTVLMDLQRQRMKLLGIDKGNDVAQNTVVNYNFGGMKDEELMAIADSLQDRKAKEILAEKSVDEQ